MWDDVLSCDAVIKTRMQAQSPVPKDDTTASRSPSPNAQPQTTAKTTEHVHNHPHGATGASDVHRHHHLGSGASNGGSSTGGGGGGGGGLRSGGFRGGAIGNPIAAAAIGIPHTHTHAHPHVHPHVHSASCGPIHLLSTPDLISRCTHYQYSNGLMDVWCLKCDLPRPVSNIRFEGPIDTAIKIVRYEGALNLWRGLAPTLVMSVPSTIIYFSAYDELKSQFERFANRRSAAAASPATASASPANGSNFAVALAPLIAGTTARAFTTTLVSPLELIRTKMQAERLHEQSTTAAPKPATAKAASPEAAAPKQRSSSVWSVIQSEIAKGKDISNRRGGSGIGVLNLWRGVAPTLWRDVPFSALYWTSYEQLKPLYLRAVTRGSNSAGRNSAATAAPTNLAWAAFLSGATAGMFSAALTHPFDVVKTRRQIEMYNFEISGAAESAASAASAPSAPSDPATPATPARRPVSSTTEILRTIWAEEGARGLYTGLIARMAKVAPGMECHFQFTLLLLLLTHLLSCVVCDVCSMCDYDQYIRVCQIVFPNVSSTGHCGSDKVVTRRVAAVLWSPLYCFTHD